MAPVEYLQFSSHEHRHNDTKSAPIFQKKRQRYEFLKLLHRNTIPRFGTSKSVVETTPSDGEKPNIADVRRALLLARTKGLLTAKEIPSLWRHPFILTGYRFLPRKRNCVRSVFAIHNETTNIWTHIIAIGIWASVVISHYFLSNTESGIFLFGITDDAISRAPLFFRLLVLFFIASSLQALISSVLFHTHSCLAHYATVTRFLCFDYSGISTGVLATVLVVQHAALLSHPDIFKIYLAGTTVIGILCIVIPWTSLYNDPKMQPYRMFLFLLLGSMGLVPFLHVWMLDGIEKAVMLYEPVVRGNIPNIIGSIAFGARIPERWAPGMFDMAGSSHNIWHIAIALGIFTMYKAMHEMIYVAMASI
ncbi:hemolysin-III related-domain-containing protein [Xylogone sp. PMI_703]|nr:hemolysin-III related-domain-containing protein [Xylogone sp. PMI_703]